MAEKGKTTVQMMAICGMHETGPERGTSETFFREYPNEWNSSGKVGLPLVHDQSCYPVLLGAFWKNKCLSPIWEKLSKDLDTTDPRRSSLVLCGSWQVWRVVLAPCCCCSVLSKKNETLSALLKGMFVLLWMRESQIWYLVQRIF